jgi:hypothetical protein
MPEEINGRKVCHHACSQHPFSGGGAENLLTNLGLNLVLVFVQYYGQQNEFKIVLISIFWCISLSFEF